MVEEFEQAYSDLKDLLYKYTEYDDFMRVLSAIDDNGEYTSVMCEALKVDSLKADEKEKTLILDCCKSLKKIFVESEKVFKELEEGGIDSYVIDLSERISDFYSAAVPLYRELQKKEKTILLGSDYDEGEADELDEKRDHYVQTIKEAWVQIEKENAEREAKSKQQEEQKKQKEQEEQEEAARVQREKQIKQKAIKNLEELKKHTMSEICKYTDTDTGMKTSAKAQRKNEPSLGSRIWGTVKHGLFTGLMALLSPITAGVWATFSLWDVMKHGFRKKSISDMKPYDTSLIPGTKDEHFEDLSGKIGELPPDQPIISDKRRMPFCYEEPIPENPADPPVVILKFKESQEGNSVGFRYGSRDDAMGHGFITMKYTKKNPITGKDERYETTFGFYPKSGVMCGADGEIAGIANGTYAAGKICNDGDHEYHIAKEFQVTNQKINQIALAAQEYAKGGYNFIERNCTTFVHDMAAVADIPMEDFMKKSDLKTDIDGQIFAAQVTMGFTKSRVLGNYLYSKADSDDYSYQKFGQKMVTREDIQHLDRSTLNKRMYGYVPAQVAENLRESEDTVILSHMDNTEITNEDFLDQLELYSKIGAVPKEKIEDTVRYIFLYEQFFKTMEKTLELPRISDTDKKKLFLDATEEINKYEKYLNTLYKDLGSPKVLNTLFQHAVSQQESRRQELKRRYNREFNLKYSLIWKDESEIVITDYADKNRDTAWLTTECLTECAFLPNGETEEQVFPFDFVAGAIAYDSIEDFIESYVLEGKNLEERVKYELAKRKGLVNTFSNIQESFAGGRELVKDDYKLAFCTLPEAEKIAKSEKYKMENLNCARLYQGLALEKIFGGMKNEIIQRANEMYESYQWKSTALVEMSAEIIKRKLAENRAEVLKLERGIREGLMSSNPYKTENYKSFNDYSRKIDRMVWETVEDSVIHVYMDSVLKAAEKDDESLFSDVPSAEELKEEFFGIFDAEYRNADRALEGFKELKTGAYSALRESMQGNVTDESILSNVSDILALSVIGRASQLTLKDGTKLQYSREEFTELSRSINEKGIAVSVLKSISADKILENGEGNKPVSDFERFMVSNLVEPLLDDKLKEKFHTEEYHGDISETYRKIEKEFYTHAQREAQINDKFSEIAKDIERQIKEKFPKKEDLKKAKPGECATIAYETVIKGMDKNCEMLYIFRDSVSDMLFGSQSKGKEDKLLRSSSDFAATLLMAKMLDQGTMRKALTGSREKLLKACFYEDMQKLSQKEKSGLADKMNTDEKVLILDEKFLNFFGMNREQCRTLNELMERRETLYDNQKHSLHPDDVLSLMAISLVIKETLENPYEANSREEKINESIRLACGKVSNSGILTKINKTDYLEQLCNQHKKTKGMPITAMEIDASRVVEKALADPKYWNNRNLQPKVKEEKHVDIKKENGVKGLV